MGVGRASRQAAAAPRLVVKDEIGARDSREAPAPRRMSVKQKAVEDDDDLVAAPAKRQRVKKEEAASKGPSEVLDLESGCKTQQKREDTRPHAKELRSKQKAARTVAVSEDGLPSLAGLLPSSAPRQGIELPLEIPKEYCEGRLHLPESVVEVKVEKPDEESIVVEMAPIPCSDSSAVCRQYFDALIKEPRSNLHSLSPVMKSVLIDVMESTEPKEQAKRGGPQKKAGKGKDMIELLKGLGHDEAALQRMQHGWSFFGPGHYHMAVNMMDKALESQEKKRARAS